MPSQYAEKEVTKAEVRRAISAVQSLIEWSAETDNVPDSFQSLARIEAEEAVQFFKDLLL